MTDKRNLLDDETLEILWLLRNSHKLFDFNNKET